MYIKGLTDEEVKSLIPHDPLIVGYRGSIAHNMYVPNTDPNSIDDKDVMAVTISPIRYYLGLDRYEGSDGFVHEWDIVTYDILKFVRLLLNMNPNVLSLLWLRKNHYIYVSPNGQRLLDNRELFISRNRIYKAFTGYAYAQLKKMENRSFEGYMGEKRKRLVKEFGYDTKNAGHLIRLLRMAIEFLTDGELHVFRDDAPQLISIKRGEWSLEKVKAEAERLRQLADEAYVRSDLPSKVDKKKVDELLVSIMLDQHGIVANYPEDFFE